MSMAQADVILSSVLSLLQAAQTASTGPLATAQLGEDVDFDSLPATQAVGVRVVLSRAVPSYPYAGGTTPANWEASLLISAGTRNDRRVAGQRPSTALLAEVHAALMADPRLTAYAVPDVIRGLQLQDMRPDTNTESATRLGVVDALYTIQYATAFDAI